MKQIQRKLGDEGFAAAIRLIEVLTYRSGVASKFNPVLTLCPPTTELWLAQEILSLGDDVHDDEKCNQVVDFLNEFSLAGLIVFGSQKGHRPVFDEAENAWKHQSCNFTTVQLVEFEELMDVWTARKVKDAQRKAE